MTPKLRVSDVGALRGTHVAGKRVGRPASLAECQSGFTGQVCPSPTL